MIPGTRPTTPLLAALCAALLLGSPLRAQEEAAAPEPELSKEQRQAADELVLLTFYGDPAEDALARGLGTFAKQYPGWLRDSLIAQGLSEQQTERLLDRSADESRRRAVRTLAERLSDERQFRVALLDMLQKLYAESYSLEEMRQLIGFWSSPVGRKLYRLNPIIREERNRRAAELLRQPLYKLSAEVVEEETRTLTTGETGSD
ncbi:MAG: DUF2059 domain-containing protein [Myxococcota bacterium]|nr:DUF2059 domain-containing protein [Myxococcota bacterium]